MALLTDIASLPVRGAWVEMAGMRSMTRAQVGRSPCGERGLKFGLSTLSLEPGDTSLPVRGAWVEIVHLPYCSPTAVVAPRAGSVG